MLQPGSIVHKRPHHHLRDDALYFLASERPFLTLNGTEQALWAALEQPRPLDDLQARFGADAVQRLSQAGCCEIIAPVADNGRRRVLVLEPHSDDAALSIGATMWALRDTVSFKLVTLASQSNFTSYFYRPRDFLDRGTVSRLRAEENALFMQHLGGAYQTLGQREATLRYSDADWSVDFLTAHRVAVAESNNRRAGEAVFAEWKAAIATLLDAESAEELWIPLGIGTHGDHELTRNTVLALLMDRPDLAARFTVRFYQDVPYDSNFPGHREQILAEFERAGMRLSADRRNVTDAFDRKAALLEIFASQFKLPAIEHGVQASAEAAGDGRKYEHLWRLEALPATLDFDRLYVDRGKIDALLPEARGWVQDAAGVKRIRVLALVPSGRWAEDAALLRQLFPKARLEVFASPAALPEITAAGDPAITVRPVDRGAKAWALLSLRLALAPRAHTIFAAGQQVPMARRLAALWPGGRTMVTASMDHARLALATASRSGPD